MLATEVSSVWLISMGLHVFDDSVGTESFFGLGYFNVGGPTSYNLIKYFVYKQHYIAEKINLAGYGSILKSFLEYHTCNWDKEINMQFEK